MTAAFLYLTIAILKYFQVILKPVFILCLYSGMARILKYYVYIMSNIHRTVFYIGVTSNIQTRYGNIKMLKAEDLPPLINAIIFSTTKNLII